jgi:putative ABC transport system permease protein
MRRVAFIARNMLAKPARLFLTAGAVAALVVLVVTLVSLLEAFDADAGPERGATRVMVQHATGLASFVPRAIARELADLPGVVAVAPEIYFSGQYLENRPEHVFGQLSTDPEAWPAIFDEYEIDASQLADWQRRADSFIAGRELAERYGWRLGDRIQLRGTYIPEVLDLVLLGTYRARNESNVFFHNRALDDTWIGRRGQAGHVVLRVEDPRLVGELTGRIEEMYANSPAPVLAMPERQFRLQFIEMIGNVEQLFYLICAIGLASTALIVTNTIAMNVRENTRELGVLRAIGFSRAAVVGVAVCETLLVTAAGSALGLPLAALVTWGLQAALEISPAATFAKHVGVSGFALVQGGLAALLLGLVSSAAPASMVARLRVADALRKSV